MNGEDNMLITENAGIVKRILVKNFMCHEHLEVNFNSHINFICGKNGSGKSAILTALVIVLGGKSSDTNRGSNIKGLIKSGKSQAVLEVTLSNLGPKAYKPEIYGNEITIIRVINASSSLYKIAKQDGKTMNCKKGELNNILNQFKIQINNPISVLNQDMAKSFIKTTNTKDLYKFFMKSTLLNEIENDISHYENVTLPELRRLLNEKNNELNHTNKNLNDLKKKHEKKKQMIELQKESENIQSQLDWVLVYNARKEKNKLNNRLEQIGNEIEDINRKMQDKDSFKKELDQKRIELTRELNNLNKEKDDKMSEVLDLERNYNKVANTLKELKTEKKVLEKKLRTSQDHYDETKKKLQTLDSQNAEAAARRDQIENKKQSLRTKIEELKTLVNTNNNHKRNLIASLKKKSEEVQAAETSLHSLLSDINKAKIRLKDLKSHSSELTCYGEFMPRLVEEIEKENRKGVFERKPVGPLGYYIKLNNLSKCDGGSFGPAIETLLGRGLLCGFAIHSSKDFEAFKNICNKLGIHNRPDVTICKFSDKIHDVRKYKVKHSTFASMFDALDFSNPVVANVIIDQCSIENILLLPTNQDAYRLMDNVKNVPNNCSNVITRDYQFYPAPNYRSYHLTRETTTKFLQVNKESLIKNLEYNLENSMKDEAKQRSILDAVKKEEFSIQKSLNQLEKEIGRIQMEITNSDLELLNLDNDEGDISHEQEALREDLSYRKRTIDQINQSIQKLSLDIEKTKTEYEEAKEAKDNATKMFNFDEEINKIQDKLNEVENQYSEYSVNFTKFRSRLKDQLTLKEKVTNSLNKLEQDVINYEEKVEGLPVIDEQSCGDKDELKERLSEVRNEIETINEFIGPGSIEEITQDLLHQIETAELIVKLIDNIKAEITKLCDKYQDIKIKYEFTLKDKSKKIKCNFRNITRLKNYESDLVFDHSNRKLNIIVKTDVKNQSTTSVLSLSGGERSYSMVAFILSLWQEMELPFYFLDEFDVFMDPVNRSLIIKLLLMHASDNYNQQYVFFTPNDFHVDSAQSVGIFRMQDPRDDNNSEF